MSERSDDWLRQAEADRRHACNARDDGDFESSVFASHHATEKAFGANEVISMRVTIRRCSY